MSVEDSEEEKKIDGYCCHDFKNAMRSGTDCEGYGALIDYPRSIGCGLPDMNFCPWCGKALNEPKTD